MIFGSVVLAVTDIVKSKEFYMDMFGLEIVEDYGEKVVFDGGFSLQESFDWLVGISASAIKYKANNMELYFEEEDIIRFIDRLKKYPKVKLMHPLKLSPWGQRVIRLYDPDGHIIEVGEPMEVVAKRFLLEGKSIEDTAKITQQPLRMVQKWYNEI